MSWVVFCGVLAPSTSTIDRGCMDVRNLGIPLVPSILRGKSYKTKLDLGVSPKILRYQTRIGRQGDMQKSCGVSYVDFRSQTQRNVKMLPGLKNIPGQPRRHCCWLWQECLAGRLAMGIQVYVYRVCFTNLIQLFFLQDHTLVLHSMDEFCWENRNRKPCLFAPNVVFYSHIFPQIKATAK